MIHNGVFSQPILIAYGNILASQNETDCLFSLLHQIRHLQNTAVISYLQGIYSFLRHNHYQALEHLNLCLVIQPTLTDAWLAIGKVRSALVCLQFHSFSLLIQSFVVLKFTFKSFYIIF